MPKRSAAVAAVATPDDLFAHPVNDGSPVNDDTPVNDGLPAAGTAEAGRGRRRPAAAPPRDGTPDESGYTAASIEVLEGLEPVRRRPGMYIGGTDEGAACITSSAEILDNSMDEAVAGHAAFIGMDLARRRTASSR